MLILQLFKKIIRSVGQVNTFALLSICIIHYFVSYSMMDYAGESDITTSHARFFYYLVVTSSTVGYGDISPKTIPGYWVVSLYIIPFGIALFSVIVTKIGSFVMYVLRKEITGMLNFNHLEHHILIMGYHALRTPEMVGLIMADKKRTPRTIVVVTDADIEHPFLDVDGVEFCRVASLKDAHSLSRVALDKADKIIVDGDDDNASYVLSSHYASLNKSAHITTHIADVVIADNLQAQHPNIEVVVDNREELMIRTMQDNGTSRTVAQLLRSDFGQTFLVTELNIHKPTIVATLKSAFQDKGAIFLGFSTDRLGKDLLLNPNDSTPLLEQQTIYAHYIAAERLPSRAITW